MSSESVFTVPLVIISPVRDEAALIQGTLDSMVAQTVRPQEWVVVDDGSKDDTVEIVRRYAAEYPFIRLVQRGDRGFRKLGGGVVAAFKFGLTQIASPQFEYIAKLDGDMSFDARYLERMFERFAADPKLAAVSGKVFRPEGDGLVEEVIIDEHVAGQFKLYRWSAYQAIGGFVEEVLWDGIDVHTARMKGWNTLSFHHPEARLYHHRLEGSSDKNVFVGRMRAGRGIYFMGYHPLYMLAASLRRMGERPYVLGGLFYMIGYLQAAVKRLPRYEGEGFREYLQAWQLQSLKRRFARALGWRG